MRLLRHFVPRNDLSIRIAILFVLGITLCAIFNFAYAATNVVSSTNTIKYARGTNDYFIVNGALLPSGIPVNRSTTTAYYFEGIVTVRSAITLLPPARSDGKEYATKVYIQDNSGGVLLQSFNDATPYNFKTANYGDKIGVTGFVTYEDYYVGETQIEWRAVLISSQNALPSPQVIKCSDLIDSTDGNDNAEKYEGLIIRLNKVNIIEGRGSGPWPAIISENSWFSTWKPAAPPHGQWNSIESSIVTDDNVYPAAIRFERGCGIGGFSTKPKAKFDVIGLVSQYSDPPYISGYQVLPRSSADLIYIPENVKAVTDANGGVSLSWDATNDPDWNGYNVYRGAKADLSDGLVIATLVKSATYYDVPPAGGIFFYAVTLHQSSGTNTLGYSTYIQSAQSESSFSNIVTNSPSSFASAADKPAVTLSAKVFNPYQNAKLGITFNGRQDSRFAVRILDVKGRIVRIPVDGAPWSFSDDSRTILWDGSYADGNKVPAGLYLIQVEETKADGSTAHTEKVAAVGIRLR